MNCHLIFDGVEWILIGRGGASVIVGGGGGGWGRGKRWFMNLGQTAVLLSHISGGHWRFEPARRNCHFISAGNRARKRNGLLFLVPLSVCFYVCVRERCDFMCVGS
ncbi:uncharacterized [Lates japonicus]